MLVRLNSVFLPDLLTMLNTLATAEFAQLPGSIKSILYLVYCTFGTGRKNGFTSIANFEQIICKCHICLILLNFAT